MSYDIDAAARKVQEMYAATEASYRDAVVTVGYPYIGLSPEEKARIESAVKEAFPRAAAGVLPIASELDAESMAARGTLTQVLDEVTGRGQHWCELRVAGRVIRSIKSIADLAE
jgi:hypothetical protein